MRAAGRRAGGPAGLPCRPFEWPLGTLPLHNEGMRLPAARRLLPVTTVFGGALLVLAATDWPSSSSLLARTQVYLGRSIGPDERARALRTGASPPPGWLLPDFDDSEWLAVPPSGPTLAGPPSAGSLWLTPATPPGSPSGAALGVASSDTPDGGLIFPEDSPPDAGSPAPSRRSADPGRDARSLPSTVDPLGGASALATAAVGGGGFGLSPVAAWAALVVSSPPVCSGTLYLRRRFDLPADPSFSEAEVGTARPAASLTLRARYSDGLAAYLNGVEVLRRRLPDAARTQAATLATDKGPSEAEALSLTLPAGLLRPQGNLLSLEVHPRGLERCAKLDMELVATTGPRVLRGPYIERMADGSADFTVETDQPTQLRFAYARGPASARLRDDQYNYLTAADKPPTTVHRVHVGGLRNGTTYHYKLSLASESGEVAVVPPTSFHTPPTAGRRLRFAVYGDSRSGHAVHSQVVQALLDEDPDLILDTGDVVARGSEDADWDRYFSVAAPLLARTPVYLTPGNHEYARRGFGDRRLFQIYATQFPVQPPRLSSNELRPSPTAPTTNPTPRDLLAMPQQAPPALGPSVPEALNGRGYYSLDLGGVHFIALDSNQLRSREQLAWLDEDLLRARRKRSLARVVWMHDGPFSWGWHGDNQTAQRDYVPVLEKHHVNLVFSGHDHNYERGRRGELDYIVTGGGGAELRPLRCTPADKPTKRRCKNPPLTFVNEHNYVLVELEPGASALKVCPKRIDGTELEPCFAIPLR